MFKRLLACIVIYGIDLLFVTPFALFGCGLREAGILNSFGLENYGFVWLPMWFVLFTVGMYLLFNWIDKLERKELILNSITITFCTLMIGTIIHNLMMIKNYC